MALAMLDVLDAFPFGTFPSPVMLQHDPKHGRRSGRGILVDVRETEAALELKADLPGVSRDAVKLSVDVPHQLTLSVAEAKETRAPDADRSKAWRLERSSHYAARTLRMPENADLQAATATLRDGVLSVTVPKKAPEPAGHSIAIE